MRNVFALGLLAVVAAATPAAAQYYGGPPPPPPGYYPPGPPGYYPPPRVPFGRRCEATMETPYGPRQLVCPIRDPKPLGEPCGCPPPRPGHKIEAAAARAPVA